MYAIIFARGRKGGYLKLNAPDNIKELFVFQNNSDEEFKQSIEDVVAYLNK